MDPYEPSLSQPQRNQGQDITFVPVTIGHTENHKKYVFVDEHNRHRRLKVMRACEGCRRRKIKCDAATTNTWPCGACVRLKLTCVPPAMNFEKDNSVDANGDSDSSETGATTTTTATDERFTQGFASDPNFDIGSTSVSGFHRDAFSDPNAGHAHPNFQLSPIFSNQSYDSAYASRGSTVGFQYQSDISFKHSIRSPVGSESGFRSETPAEELSEHLGVLKIDENAIAPYITNQTKNLADTPAMEDFEVPLPKSVGSDLMVRIPPEMMPSDQLAMQYFEYFFANIHPYVPVLNRTYFYQQWNSSRHKISPLILEAVFACSSRLMNHETEGNQWLALISKHEESFKDVPRLSTIQAMLLVLKAREAIPKRGYYYRSWMTIVNLIAMAKDLGLDEHYEDHQIGKPCNSTLFECAAKSRVWHSLFIVELMVGGPQGRTDWAVHMDTVEFDVPKSIQGLDEAEIRISQQYSYFMRVVKNIRETNMLFAKLRKKNPDFALIPEFVAHNANFEPWLQSLPAHLRISYPEDGSPPYIPFHFVANIHSYHHLSVIMQHRPQLQAAAEAMDGSWKELMLICYSAAKKLCRLQEAIMQNYGLPGLLCMLRGINFTIYAIMTCTMVHLVALTSPDPEVQDDAAEYFPRHMRILEQCMDSWPMPEMRMQIDSLREAFSADTSKPFELKASFPYSSPKSMNQHSPRSDPDYGHHATNMETPSEHSSQTLFRTVSGDPNMSGAEAGIKLDDSAMQSFDPMTGHVTQSQQVQATEPSVQWNPTKLFDQWNSAFFTPPPSATSPQYPFPPSASQDGISVSGNPFRSYPTTSEPVTSPSASQRLFPPQVQRSPVHPPPVGNYVTPDMWQAAVAGTYGSGMKRRWEDHLEILGLKRAK